MHLSQEVEKTIFPLKIIWLALSGSLFVYAFVIYQTHGFSLVDTREAGTLPSVLIPFSYAVFIFVFLVFTKKNWVLTKFFLKGNKNRGHAPYLKTMTEEDKEYLSQFGPYMGFHILAWALSESGAILAFVVTFTSGNFTYYIISGSIALAFNLLLFKPDYKNFKKSYEQNVR